MIKYEVIKDDSVHICLSSLEVFQYIIEEIYGYSVASPSAEAYLRASEASVYCDMNYLGDTLENESKGYTVRAIEG